jgi:RND family efflux transporter MFP subunit
VGVKVGDQVYAGQGLAALAQGDLSGQIASLVALRDAAQSKLADLKGGARDEDIAIAETRVVSAKSQAELAVSTLADTLNDAYAKFDDAVRTKGDVFFSNPRSTSPQFTLIATDSQIKIKLEGDRLALESQLNLLQTRTYSAATNTEVADVKDLANKIRVFMDTISTSLNLAQGYTSLTPTEIEAYKGTVSGGRLSISGYISALSAAQNAARTSEIAVKTAESELVRSKVGATVDEIRIQEAQIRAANANIYATSALQSKRSISAPFSGQITKVDPKVGSISTSSDVISLISNSKLQMETYVPEVYIAKINKGDRAEMTLDAYGSQQIFTGLVATIEPSSTLKDGVSTYKTIIVFDKADSKIRPGMGGDIKITGSKGVPVVTIPKKSIIQRNGKDYVQIPAGGATDNSSAQRVIEREIVVGKYNEADIAEVTEGLADGDVIVVTPLK